MISQRTLIGITAIVCAAWGSALSVLVQDSTSSFSGILIKMGLMLGVIWLAMPSLVNPQHHKSLYLVGGLFLFVFLAAARPKILLGVLLVGAIAYAINWLLKRIAKESR